MRVDSSDIKIYLIIVINMKNNPLVSVILPTYNWEPERLSQSIDSVLNQTFKNFELIIINDSSTNDIEKTIIKYAKVDPRIVYLKNDKNLKLSKTLNKWIEYSKWKYIARIDDDDVWLNADKLERQVDFMEHNPLYWLCGWDWIVIINKHWHKINEHKMKISDDDIRNYILQANQFTHSSVFIRKSALEDVWLYNAYYYPAEDYELWCRIWRKFKMYNIQGITLKYRINEKWMSQQNKLKMRKKAFEIFVVNRKYYPNFFRALIIRILDFLIPDNIKEIIFKFLRGK